ncbi:hypothetical protein QHH11_10090 [Aphanizomenon sp. PH219]|jgi:hypothetical protein|nr:hypothetical protein [Aphanizomenon sp. 202]MDK2459482.1 hypothetical protein [Aphanizomenon sp. PH219]
MKPFVGYQEKPLSVPDLLRLIDKLKTENTYYFLRWTNKVSGIIEKLPDKFPMLEGQMFNHQFELRWKHKRQNTYEVLLLTIDDNHHGFTKLAETWEIEPNDEKKFPSYAYPAHGYRPEETRFPQKFIYADSLDIRLITEESNKPNKPKLAQRYFLDKKTATVHFVALTVEK